MPCVVMVHAYNPCLGGGGSLIRSSDHPQLQRVEDQLGLHVTLGEGRGVRNQGSLSFFSHVTEKLRDIDFRHIWMGHLGNATGHPSL